jgi:hypothetical protein
LEQKERNEIEVTTKRQLRRRMNSSVTSSDIYIALDSFIDELNSIKGNSAVSRMVPVDYQIADTDLQYTFDLDEIREKIKLVAREWHDNKQNKKYIAPYFCFIQSSGMGKTKLMFEFVKLMKMGGEDELSTK